ncbi:MAG: hypothetical protein Q9201_006313 [Fulgogasparrea decipioides]
MHSSLAGWMRPTPFDSSLAEIRRHYQEDGYVWIKKVIPRKDVYDMREQYAAFASTLTSPSPQLILPCLPYRDALHPDLHTRFDICNPSADPTAYQGIGGLPEPSTNELLNTAHADPVYCSLLAHPSIRTFIRHFTGWPQERILDRAMLRHNCPVSQSTGIHYDQYFLRAGENEFLTAWIPIGDCALLIQLDVLCSSRFVYSLRSSVDHRAVLGFYRQHRFSR